MLANGPTGSLWIGLKLNAEIELNKFLELSRQNWQILKHLESNPVCRGSKMRKSVPRTGPFANTTSDLKQVGLTISVVEQYC